MLERVLVLAFLLIVFGVPAGITWLKGHRGAFIIGFIVLGMVWWIAACRLAHPSSWWARQFYGRAKMRRALTRFGSETAATS